MKTRKPRHDKEKAARYDREDHVGRCMDRIHSCNPIAFDFCEGKHWKCDTAKYRFAAAIKSQKGVDRLTNSGFMDDKIGY